MVTLPTAHNRVKVIIELIKINFSSRLFLSIASIAFATALFIGATVAFFSDTETAEDNVLVAGAIDLKIDNTSYLNGVLQDGTNGTAGGRNRSKLRNLR